MYTVILINKNSGKEFEKKFSSPYLMEKFINKCKYSKKVKVIGVVKEW